MKTVYLLFPLFFLSPVILLPCSASPNSQLSLPAAIRNTDKQSPELLQLKKLLDETKKDNVLIFEKLGVDYLFVDEADAYKNLFLYTKRSEALP